MKTKVINLISGPGAGKTTSAALIFAELKIRGKITEWASEYAKKLVWLERWDILNNQHIVSLKQYELLKSMNSRVEFIVTDGPLVQGLYYNRYNTNNLSNVEKTQEFILKSNAEFSNINIFLTRGAFPYEEAGRYQTFDEAKQVDIDLKNILDELHVNYKEFSSGKVELTEMIEYILSID